MSGTEWVMAIDNGAGARCERCEATFHIELPCPVPVWVAAMRAFVKLHSRCAEKPKQVRA